MTNPVRQHITATTRSDTTPALNNSPTRGNRSRNAAAIRTTVAARRGLTPIAAPTSAAVALNPSNTHRGS